MNHWKDLMAWQKSHELILNIYLLTGCFPGFFDACCGILQKLIKNFLDRINRIFRIIFSARIPEACGQGINCSRSIKSILPSPIGDWFLLGGHPARQDNILSIP